MYAQPGKCPHHVGIRIAVRSHWQSRPENELVGGKKVVMAMTQYAVAHLLMHITVACVLGVVLVEMFSHP